MNQKVSIIHISAECYPFAKVGGLADVVGTLPKYQSKEKLKSVVIMPFYNVETIQKYKYESIYTDKIQLSNEVYNFEILKTKKTVVDFDIFFIDIPNLLFKDYIYSHDDSKRFIAFQVAALDWVLKFHHPPKIIHCHDHHTGLIPFMLQECFKYKSLNKVPVVTTIHNAQYQGCFSDDKLPLLPDFNSDKNGLLHWHNHVNPLAAAIKCAWKVTTVSPSYMEELKTSANELEGLIYDEYDKCQGILNGIDTDVWNTETDSYLVKNYTQRTIISGKKAHKKWLCKKYNLDETKPLFIFIGRLVWEKGADLLPKVCAQTLDNLDVSIFMLGSGNKDIQQQLGALNDSYLGRYYAHAAYDERLSHILYAAADFLLMPSRVEPCGLNQMYAFRYGTIPIARRIGGLQDTITDIGDGGLGILHQHTTLEDITYAISRAVDLYGIKTTFNKTRKSIMNIDYSWDKSSGQYITLYKSLNKKL